MTKSDIARCQLGTALDMFIQGQDPVSVHCLAMAGGEVAEWLAENAGGEPFKSHILETFPVSNLKEIRKLQRQYWNAFKHATERDGKAREDEKLLASFDPTVNDHMLFVGWHDYGMAGLALPIEAQIFEAWYLAKYPEKVSSEASIGGVEYVFPNLSLLSPDEQHDKLAEAIIKWRQCAAVMEDPGTDRRPLVMPWG
jgi:hypothetical protein